MPIVALILAIVAVSTSAPLIHWAKPASALTIASSRVLLAAVVLLAISGPQMRALLRAPRKHQIAIVGSGFLLAAHFGVWISSLYYTSTAASVALVATQPAFAGVIGWVVLKDRMSRREVLGILVAAAGCAVLALGDTGPSSDNALLGDALALAGAVTAAAYLVVGRGVRETMPLAPYLAAVNTIAGLLLLAAALVLGAQFGGLPTDSYIAIALCALLPSLVGHTLLNYCVRRVPVHLVSLGILGEPIGASLLALAFLGEEPPSHAVLGGAIIVVGIALGFVKKLPSQRASATERGKST